MTIPLRVILIAIVIHTLWGGNPVAAKLAFVVFPPMWSSFLRFAMGVSCLIVWARFCGIRLTPERRKWAGLGWCSVLFFIQIALLNIGADLTSGSLAAILIATNPLFSALCAHFVIAGDRLTRVKSLGLGIAFVGVVLILARGADFDAVSNTGNWGNWIVLMSAGLLGARLIFTARLVRYIDPTRVIIWQMILSMPPFLVAALWFETITWPRLDWIVAAGLGVSGRIDRRRRFRGDGGVDEALHAQRHDRVRVHLSDFWRVVEHVALIRKPGLGDICGTRHGRWWAVCDDPRS